MKRLKILFISVVFGTLFVSQMSGNVALKSPSTIKATLDGNLAITTESKKAAGVPASYSSSVSTIKSVNGLDFSSNDAFQTNAAVFVLQIAVKAYNNLLLEKNLRDYQQSDHETRITASEKAISTLNGTSSTEGSVAHTVAAEIAKVVAGADESYDTLKEIADWISTHSQSAAAMNSAISANTSSISSLQSGKNDKIYITDSSAALSDSSTVTTFSGASNPTSATRWTLSTLWTYIKDKISSVLGLTSSKYSGVAAKATQLETTRTINGTNFNGTAIITTANWGTARNISIADSDAGNTGAAVSVNGSAAVTLKLPSTIKATLNGNASTATSAIKATQDASGNVIASTYIKNLSVSGTTITYTKGDNKTGTITTHDTTYTAGSNISIDSSNQISAVLPAIKVDSTGNILNQSDEKMTANYVDLGNPATVVSNASTLPNTAGMYLVYKDGYIPKVAIVKYSSDEGKYSFV